MHGNMNVTIQTVCNNEYIQGQTSIILAVGNEFKRTARHIGSCLFSLSAGRMGSHWFNHSTVQW